MARSMFWRLFVTYLVFVVLAVAVVGLALLRRNPDADLLREVIVAGLIVAAVAVLPAFLLARRFTHPLDDLTDGATRLAEGDLGHKIRVEGSREFAALARTFNAMSETLAQSFALLDRDKEQLRTILSGMVEGVVAVDPEQRVLFANDRAGELLGFSTERAVGKTLSELSPELALQDIVDKAIRGREPHRSEFKFKSRDPVQYVAVYAARLPGPGTPGVVLVLNDVSELRHLEHLRQDFAANVSHELKTPLSVMKSNLEALQDGAADDIAVRGEFLNRVSLEADRLEALIQDLLRLSRIESGDFELELEPIPVAKAIELALDRQAMRAESKTLQLIEVPTPEPVAVWADDESLSTVLDNLIDNAIKYTSSGGRITVRWTATVHNVAIEVQDTGIGLAARDLPRVFERFYRADKARSRAAGGTGLGLAIVKHLVQAMKGQVSVESELGKGTTFRVMLPRAELLSNEKSD